MNDTVINFLVKHDMDLEKLSKVQGVNNIKTQDIDPLLMRYNIDGKTEWSNVCVGDILGYDPYTIDKSNIFENLVNFFDIEGDGYHQRACGMLRISNEDIISELSFSFKNEPIVLKEVHPGKYLVATNGLHRYMLLKAHYINEICELEHGSNQYSLIREKYTIPVRTYKIDLIKSYCKYIIENHIDKYSVSAEYDGNWNQTECVKIINDDETKENIEDNQLIKFARYLLLDKIDPNLIETVEEAINNSEMFAAFIENYIPEIKFSNILAKKTGL